MAIRSKVPGHLPKPKLHCKDQVSVASVLYHCMVDLPSCTFQCGKRFFVDFMSDSFCHWPVDAHFRDIQNAMAHALGLQQGYLETAMEQACQVWNETNPNLPLLLPLGSMKDCLEVVAWTCIFLYGRAKRGESIHLSCQVSSHAPLHRGNC